MKICWVCKGPLLGLGTICGACVADGVEKMDDWIEWRLAEAVARQDRIEDILSDPTPVVISIEHARARVIEELLVS